MTNSIVRIAAATAVASVMVFASSGASAQLRVGGGGIDVVAPPNTAVAQADPAMAIIRDTRRNGGQTLRCWQHGRLLYEGAGFRGGVTGSNAISVPRRNGDGEAVTVFNLANGICILAD